MHGREPPGVSLTSASSPGSQDSLDWERRYLDAYGEVAADVLDPNGFDQNDGFVVANDIVQYSTSAGTSDMDRDFAHIEGQRKYRPRPGEGPEEAPYR